MIVQSGPAKVSLFIVLILCSSSGNQWSRAEVAVSGGTFQNSSTKYGDTFAGPLCIYVLDECLQAVTATGYGSEMV